MSKIINRKLKKEFYIADRALLRDTRISANAKNIYYVLNSLAETCDNVYPSHFWMAVEIGYNTEVTLTEDELHSEDHELILASKKENKLKAVQRFIKDRLDELESINLIKVIKNQGYTNDYEVYDYIDINEKIEKLIGESNPPQKRRYPPHKIDGSTPHKIDGEEIREENKEIVRDFNNFEKKVILETVQIIQRFDSDCKLESEIDFQLRIEEIKDKYKREEPFVDFIYEVKRLTQADIDAAKERKTIKENQKRELKLQSFQFK